MSRKCRSFLLFLFGFDSTASRSRLVLLPNCRPHVVRHRTRPCWWPSSLSWCSRGYYCRSAWFGNNADGLIWFGPTESQDILDGWRSRHLALGYFGSGLNRIKSPAIDAKRNGSVTLDRLGLQYTHGPWIKKRSSPALSSSLKRCKRREREYITKSSMEFQRGSHKNPMDKLIRSFPFSQCLKKKSFLFLIFISKTNWSYRHGRAIEIDRAGRNRCACQMQHSVWFVCLPSEIAFFTCGRRFARQTSE